MNKTTSNLGEKALGSHEEQRIYLNYLYKKII